MSQSRAVCLWSAVPAQQTAAQPRLAYLVVGNSDTIEEDAGRYRIMMCSINIPLLPCRKSKQQTMLCYDKVEGND